MSWWGLPARAVVGAEGVCQLLDGYAALDQLRVALDTDLLGFQSGSVKETSSAEWSEEV